MPKQHHTEIVCIIDRSGSMSGLRHDAVVGVNTFLASQQRQPGTASLSLILFNVSRPARFPGELPDPRRSEDHHLHPRGDSRGDGAWLLEDCRAPHGCGAPQHCGAAT